MKLSVVLLILVGVFLISGCNKIDIEKYTEAYNLVCENFNYEEYVEYYGPIYGENFNYILDKIELCHSTGGCWSTCSSRCSPWIEKSFFERLIPKTQCDAECYERCFCPPERRFWDEEKGCVS